ncbi:hypothetical protein V1520DRAFT_174333 [Lipomyces starkeyi]
MPGDIFSFLDPLLNKRENSLRRVSRWNEYRSYVSPVRVHLFIVTGDQPAIAKLIPYNSAKYIQFHDHFAWCRTERTKFPEVLARSDISISTQEVNIHRFLGRAARDVVESTDPTICTSNLHGTVVQLGVIDNSRWRRLVETRLPGCKVESSKMKISNAILLDEQINLPCLNQSQSLPLLRRYSFSLSEQIIQLPRYLIW